MQLASVEEVKDLHHHECVKDEGEVSRVYSVRFQNTLIVLIAIEFIKPAATHSASDHSFVPLILRVTCEDSVVVRILKLRDEALSCEHEHEHHDELEDALANDMLEHGLGDDVFVPRVRMTF